MQGRYIKIFTKFWTDEKVLSWDEQTKLLALYILTSPHNNIIGCYYIPKLYICADLKLLPEQLDKPFQKLLDDDFVKYDEQSSLLLITNFLKHNPLENQNQVTAAIKILEGLPRSPLLGELKPFLEPLGKPFLEPLLERLPEPVTVTVTVTDNSINNICPPLESEMVSECDKKDEQKKSDTISAEKSANEKADGAEQKIKAVRKGSNSPDYTQEFEEFWGKYPRKIQKIKAFKCYQTRKKEGHLPRDMLEAVTNFRAECLKKGTSQDYIQYPSTFLGPNKPFLDYIKPKTDGKVVNLDEFKPYTGETSTEFKPYRG